VGLDIGVVRVSYLERPSQPVYDFLWNLASTVCGADWGGSWEGNAFVEFTRRHLLSKARRYAREQKLLEDDFAKLLDWIRDLPWDGNTIMLRLYW